MQKNEIDKTIFYQWLQETLQKLVLFYRQSEVRGYGKLDPDHIVIGKDNKIYLMKLNQKSVQVHFLCEKNFIIDSEDYKSADIYNFGKIIQFILAHLKCVPKLTKREENMFLRFVNKCISTGVRQNYRDVWQLQKNLPRQKREKGKNQKRLRIKILLFIILFAMFLFSISDRDSKINEEDHESDEYQIEEMYDVDEEIFE